MAARFVAASSQYLVNAAPAVVTFPFSVGIWVRPAVAATNMVAWTIGHATTASHWFRLIAGSVGTWRISASAGGTEVVAACGTVVAGEWQFVVCRVIASTNRKIAVIKGDGSISHGTSGFPRTPSLDSSVIGADLSGGTYSTYWDGMLGEYWVTDSDIQPDGAQLQDSTLRQLAYGGPFSIPHVAKNVVEYRSFRSCLDSRADKPNEVYHRGTRQVWTNTNGVTLGAHPPYADNYVSPLTEDSPMVIV